MAAKLEHPNMMKIKLTFSPYVFALLVSIFALASKAASLCTHSDGSSAARFGVPYF